MLKDFFTNDARVPVDDEIDAVLKKMKQLGVDSDQYPGMMSYLERLMELRTKQRYAPVSRDTLALIIGNLMGILLIVAYEQNHVMSSKALSNILRPR